MHLFDTSDPRVLATKIPFYITFLFVAFATYVLSAIGFAFVHDTNLRNPFSWFKLPFSRPGRGHDKPVNLRDENGQRGEEDRGSNAEEKGRRWFFSRRRRRSRPPTEEP
jgi:hypothetical protein